MDSPKQAQALQIIATDEPGHEGKFILKEDNLKSIIEKIPPGMKVGVVSVVGAFRTGKSFLLNLFLRYLRSDAELDLSQGWMVTDGEVLLEGNLNDAWSFVDSDQARSETHSFGWRGGKDRQTTGIWMWSEPVIRQTVKSGETMAVLLMDTQGMFDNETTMTLTAQIFGLSTLVASFQVYNVDKRIQEDNLQHLALFSEYGRMSLLPKNKQIKELGERVLERMNTERRLKLVLEPEASGSSEDAGKIAADLPVDTRGRDSDDDEVDTGAAAEGGAQEGSSATGTGGDDVNAPDTSEPKPFQRLQFLVRDWQNFDEDSLPEDEGRKEGSHHVFGSPALERVEALRADMQNYLQEVLRTRAQGDLASTREQIVRCFDQLDCFMLPHPGFAVTKKNYDGDLTKIDPFFRGMINYYVRFVFDQELEAKLINNVSVTGQELLMYIQIYVNMFASEEGAGFPKAMTVLDATAEGNNRIALERALDHYKRNMDKVAGGNCSFVKEEELAHRHVAVREQSMKTFDEIATMGMPSNILRFREQLETTVGEEFKRYQQTNSLRNPFKDVEFYILPMSVAAVALVLSKLVDWTCSNDFCEAVEDTFVNIYLFVFFAILVLAWNHIKGAVKYVKNIVMPLILARAENAFEKHMQKEAGTISDDTAL